MGIIQWVRVTHPMKMLKAGKRRNLSRYVKRKAQRHLWIKVLDRDVQLKK
jgi:hypothetical protein